VKQQSLSASATSNLRQFYTCRYSGTRSLPVWRPQASYFVLPTSGNCVYVRKWADQLPVAPWVSSRRQSVNNLQRSDCTAVWGLEHLPSMTSALAGAARWVALSSAVLVWPVTCSYSEAYLLQKQSTLSDRVDCLSFYHEPTWCDLTDIVTKHDPEKKRRWRKVICDEVQSLLRHFKPVIDS